MNPEQQKLQQQIMEIEKLAKQQMTNEAISRYGALKSAHQERALQAIAVIARLAQENQIKEKITDEQFKSLLQQLDSEKKEFKIKKI